MLLFLNYARNTRKRSFEKTVLTVQKCGKFKKNINVYVFLIFYFFTVTIITFT